MLTQVALTCFHKDHGAARESPRAWKHFSPRLFIPRRPSARLSANGRRWFVVFRLGSELREYFVVAFESAASRGSEKRGTEY